MSDKNPMPDTTAGRRKRTAPTIDLEAKEIPYANVSESDAAVAAADNATSKPGAAEAPSLETETGAPSAVRTESSANARKPLLIGGIVGAAAAALVVFIGWSAGLFANHGVAAPDPRVAALEAQLKELQSRSVTASAGGGSVDTLGARLAKVEGDVSKLSPDDTALRSLGLALAALNRRYDDLAATVRDAQTRADAAEKVAADLRRNVQDVSNTAAAGASSADVASLQQRLAALEEQSKTAQADLAKATESDRAARLALSAAAVRDAVLRGVPFAEELAQAKALGAGETALAQLWPLAASGVPSGKTLTKELTDLLPQLKKAVGATAQSGGFLDRLQANAENLVRVRPADAPAGPDAGAVLARIEQAAAHDNITAALAEIGALPESGRQVAAAWVTHAGTRQKALDAARDFSASSTRALGSK